jgi:hypothetical protein
LHVDAVEVAEVEIGMVVIVIGAEFETEVPQLVPTV